MACLMMERHGVEVAGVPEKRKSGVCWHRVLHAGWEKVGEERLSVGWIVCSVQVVSHSLEFVIGKEMFLRFVGSVICQMSLWLGLVLQ